MADRQFNNSRSADPPKWDSPPPAFMFVDVVEAERRLADSIAMAVTVMHGHLQSLGAAVELRNALESGRMPKAPRMLRQAWIRMAARDGTMSIYHFVRALNGMREALNQCAILKAETDFEQIDITRRALRKAFPGLNNARDAIAHAGEIHANHRKPDEGIATDINSPAIKIAKGAKVTIVDMMTDDGIVNGHKGQLVGVPVDAVALMQVQHSFSTVVAAFPARHVI